MEQKYTPISCVYYDLIEHYAVRKELVTIVVKNEDAFTTYQSRILDTQVRNKVEYIKLETPAIEIRMDLIVSLNDEKLADYESC